MFPATRISIIQKLQNPAERDYALDAFAKLYWLPVYKYLRTKWNQSEEDAKDLTQAFFLRSIEKNFFGGFDPQKARFRTFLRVCVDGFAGNERKARRAAKRGGQALQVSVELQMAERELKELQTDETPERMFEKEWARSVFRISLEKLSKEYEQKGKAIVYRIFEQYELGSDQGASYKDLAAQFSLPATQITNYLADARKKFRRIVLETLQTATASEEEYRSEVRSLLGIRL